MAWGNRLRCVGPSSEIFFFRGVFIGVGSIPSTIVVSELFVEMVSREERSEVALCAGFPLDWRVGEWLSEAWL